MTKTIIEISKNSQSIDVRTIRGIPEGAWFRVALGGPLDTPTRIYHKLPGSNYLVVDSLIGKMWLANDDLDSQVYAIIDGVHIAFTISP